MAHIVFVHQLETQIACNVHIEEETVQENALLTFISPRVDAIGKNLIILITVIYILVKFLRRCALQNEQPQEISLITK